jgi:CBS domain containing-hemolysin-like protein
VPRFWKALRRRSSADDRPQSTDGTVHEQQILAALASLGDTMAREVMTPRVDVVALSVPVTLDDVSRAVRESGHSRFPVYEEDLDHLVGVLFVKDLLRSGWLTQEAQAGQRDTRLDMSRRVREPFLVPESRHVLELLSEMRQRRKAFAVVVDEYGGVEGVLTVKDLVGEVVGDLLDEFDRPADEPITRVDRRRWLVDGSCPVDEVGEHLGLELPPGEYVTLGGFLFDGFGHIPTEGEQLTVSGWELRVAEMDRHRVAKVVIRAPSGTIGEAPPEENGK